ncbi:thioredoxin [Candidatus Omnitrophota bacterium]
MSGLLHLSDKNFTEVINGSGLPVLVDFWASWCPPCKMVEPVLEELAEEEKDKIRIAKVNVDQSRRAASDHNIIGVPTFIIFNSGKAVCRRTAAQSKKQLKDMLKEARV